jgi:hypothetical protein
MDVFIGNLPGSATLIELFSFLEGVDLRTDLGWLEGRDRQDRDYHFVVAHTASREEGMALIARLQGRLFDGKPIEVREYQRREPRPTWKGVERRSNAC